MNATDNNPIPVPDARLTGAYWLAPRAHEQDTCTWCVQLREADAHARPVQREGRRSPEPWIVPPGLPPRPAQSGT
ncbi:hypothetical protein [Streptomyces sp. NBC_00829]|uniref:hypothetical protein n=1 Tax=Streptomyces sp. NBC_00829 TaxID=2903679 RepID=UPI0038682E29|nr:hypothetical protein OG293_34340 [Streptomyces sp. NBC_00829]